MGQVTVLVLFFRTLTPGTEVTAAAAAALSGGGQHRERGWDNAQTLSWLSLHLSVSMAGGTSRPTGPLAHKRGRGMGRGKKEGNKQTNSINSLWRRINLLIIIVEMQVYWD